MWFLIIILPSAARICDFQMRSRDDREGGNI